MFCVHARRTASLLVLLIVLTGAGTAAGEIPRKINYQGRLSDSSTGEPLAGSRDMVFRIYDADEDGTELWSEPISVPVDSAGVFSVVLGGVTPINISLDGPVWLEVEVGGEALAPRREVVSVPFAFRAMEADHAADTDSLGGYGADGFVLKGEDAVITSEMILGGAGSGLDADMVDGFNADAFADTGHTHNRLAAPDGSPAAAVYVDEDGDVGIGTTTPDDRFQVDGVIHSSTGGFRFPDGSLQATAATGGTAGAGWVDDSTVVRLEDPADSVGIGTATPAERLDVDGTARMTGFKLPTGAANGRVLTSDASGTGTWQEPPGGDGHSLDGAGGTPTDAVYVDAVGNVGIGTTSPNSDIHLYRNINGSTKITIENPHLGESSTESLIFADENGEAAGITLTDDGFAPRPRNMRIFNDRPLGGMTFSTNGVNRMWIGSDGNVGIGTSNPFQDLEITGETGVWATIKATGSNSIAGLGISNDVNSWEIGVRGDFGDALIIRDNNPGNNRMVIDDNGDVGFNTTTPANALHLHKASATSCNIQVTNGSTGSASSDGLRLGVDNLRNAYVQNRENTNLYLGSNGDIDFTITPDGDVGIGTNSPTSASLQIYRSGASTCNIKLTNGTTGPLSGDGLALGIGTTGEAYISNGENTALSLSTNGTARLRVAADGRVGIGETSPSSLLDLKGSDPYIDLNTTNAVTGLRLQKNGTTKWEVAWNEGSGYMYLWSGGGAGTSLVVEDATGDVGIGTSGPTSRLHVNGANGHSQLRLQDSYTPTGTSDPNGNTGDIAWDNNYFYVKTGAGWKRAALSTF